MKALICVLTFAPVKEKVKTQINAFNNQLNKLMIATNKDYQSKHINIKLIDFSRYFNDIVDSHSYKNTIDPWLGTYTYPVKNGYLWWDSWHPMTSMHDKIAQYASNKLSENGFIVQKICSS